jgi:hypothetical protein
MRDDLLNLSPPGAMPNRRRPALRFSLRAFFIVFTALTLYLGWNVYLVQRRSQLLARRAEHGAHVVKNWEGDAGAPQADKDRVAPTVMAFFESRNKFGSNPKILLSGPETHGDLSFIRRALGDELVAWIVLTDAAALSAYRDAFPEATIVVDSAAQASIDETTRKLTAWRLQRQRSATPRGK